MVIFLVKIYQDYSNTYQWKRNQNKLNFSHNANYSNIEIL